jgi:hypothetical protein
VLMVWIGVYPGTFLGKTQVSVDHFIGQMQVRMQAQLPTDVPAAASVPVALPTNPVTIVTPR